MTFSPVVGGCSLTIVATESSSARGGGLPAETLHAVRLRVENTRAERVSVPIAGIEMITGSDRVAPAEMLIEFAELNPGEAVEGWVVCFLPPHERPVSIRVIDASDGKTKLPL